MIILSDPTIRLVGTWERDFAPESFRLVDPMVFQWSRFNAVVKIPAGFVTNFASIPPGFRNAFSINGDSRLPAIVHDYLYDCAGWILSSHRVNNDGTFYEYKEPRVIKYTRADADWLFRQALHEAGEKPLRSALMFYAVRLFGGHFTKEWKS